MKRILLVISLALNICTANAVQETRFDDGSLSEKGRAAYQKLLAAEIFSVGGVGYDAHRSQEELALYDLLEEKQAVEALKSLVSDGSYEGGLYGLLGLSVTNVGEFNRAVDVYRSRGTPPLRTSPHLNLKLQIPEGKVLSQMGCLIFTDDWQKFVTEIQSGHYDKGLSRKYRPH